MLKLYKTKFQSALPVFFVLTALLLLSGCKTDGPQTIGVSIPSDVELVKLETVLTNPSEYDGKQIVMKGVITGQCASGCDFSFRDGVHKVTVFPEGYRLPQLGSGKPVSVFAKITAGPENVVISALGLRVDPGGKI